MASAHPPQDWLSSYAAGAASDGVALLVAAHVTYCPRCRAAICAAERLGGGFFAWQTPSPMSEGALEATLSRLDASERPSGDREAAGAGLPKPVLEAAGAPIETLRWRFRMPGVHEVDLAAEGAEKASLLRVRPGTRVPSHTHTGTEATLVLRGALIDRGRVFRPGDVAVATEADDHHPEAGPGEDCVCLAVLAGGLRFTGAFGRALNIFAE